MNNYYEECIQNIEDLIKSDKIEEAKKLLYTELSMPYIPQNFKDKFDSLLMEIEIKTHVPKGLLTDIDDIKLAFMKDDSHISLALMSLEAMNLRPYIEDVKELLNSNIDDQIKRIILLISSEQELKFSLEMILDNKSIMINMDEILNPYHNPIYQKIYQELHDELEAHDPSFLALCLEDLNMKTMSTFPRFDEDLNTNKIMEDVRSYLNN